MLTSISIKNANLSFKLSGKALPRRKSDCNEIKVYHVVCEWNNYHQIWPSCSIDHEKGVLKRVYIRGQAPWPPKGSPTYEPIICYSYH